MTDSAPNPDTCPDCHRPIAAELGPISPKRPCARHLHPAGADDCMMVALEWKDERIAALESELSALRERDQRIVTAVQAAVTRSDRSASKERDNISRNTLVEDLGRALLAHRAKEGA